MYWICIKIKNYFGGFIRSSLPSVPYTLPSATPERSRCFNASLSALGFFKTFWSLILCDKVAIVKELYIIENGLEDRLIWALEHYGNRGKIRRKSPKVLPSFQQFLICFRIIYSEGYPLHRYNTCASWKYHPIPKRRFPMTGNEALVAMGHCMLKSRKFTV